MRYNASELKHIAMTSARLCSKEGVLSLKEKEGKLWNKTDVLTERWCRLIDNLLFYFKTKDMTSDPHGIFVLEGSHVRPVIDESQGCAFILEFDGDNRSAYFLASEATDAKEWIKVLENASYTKLKQKYESLVNQQKELLGESSQQSRPHASFSRQMAFRETKSANSSPTMVLHRNLSQSPDFNMSLSDYDGIPSESRSTTKKKLKKKNKQKKFQHPDSTLPILEVVLSCTNLNIPKAIDHKRPVQINVLSLLPPAADWKTTFNTECQKAADNLGFHSTLSFYQSHLLTPHTLLRFHLCQHKENNTVSSLGCVTCAVDDLFGLTRQLTLEFEKGSIPIGKLHLHVLKEHISPQLTKNSSESKLSTVLLPSHSSSDILNSPVDSSYGDIGQVPNLKSLYCEAISRTYRFPMSDGKFCSVQEIMLETRLSLHIPHLYLKLLIDQETGYIGTLNSIKFLAERLHLSRTRHIECKTSLLQQYHDALKNVVNQNRAISFKPSIHKTDKEYEFEPTNLHMQRMRVQHSDCISALALESTKDPSGTCSAGVYDIITVGAATAHSMKYKQGGLLTLIPTASERLKKGTLISGFSRNDELKEITELPVTLPDLHKDINCLVNTLETLFQAGKECKSVPNRESTESTVFKLSDKTCKLVSLLDNKELCKVLHVLLNHSNGPPSSTSSLVNAATSLVSATGLEWEEMKTSVKTKLSELVKKIHLMMDAADDFLSLRHDYSPPSFDDVLTDFKELSSRITSVVNLAMQGHAIHIMQSPQELSETIYRRDVVFSQVLSSCVCGVATNLFSSLHDALYLENIAKYGMLIEFESLLSTYKNELKMLEDYVVGVYDLSNVSFCCDRAPEQDGDSMDHLLPTLHGTRNKIVVRLHLDPVAFSYLPDSLKSGEHFQIVPVMFNVGINEEQSLSDRIHNTSLQEYLNMDSCSRLKDYCQNWKKSCMRAGDIDERLQKLDEVVHSKKKKKVEILHLSAEICRMLNGVRVTSCKSAKDRTAMSVTLEQVQVLQQNHNLSSSSSSSALNCMRSEGTRRENTRKNVGVRKYAFTGVQLMTFPKQYKPPEGTYGNAKT